MATLIPDSLPAKSTNGEKEMARLLRRLPDDWIVYYEPSIRGFRPDFVILAPAHGVLVLEVKDWKISSIQSIAPDIVVQKSGTPPADKSGKNPLEQVRRYWQAVKDECQTCLFGQELVAREGPWKGRLCFPVGSVVIFTGIEQTNVERSPHRAAWMAVFRPENTVLADQKRKWNDLDEAGLVAALKPFFQPFDMRRRFTAHQIDVLRWVLFPESRMDVILSRNRADHEQVMEVLDARQEQHARSLGSGHRILSGIAGSGKTVLLLARARCLASANPEKRTLLLCYNKVLAEWLRARVADCPGVTVRHFDGFASGLRLSRLKGEDGLEQDAEFGQRVLDELRKRGERERVWDAVLIDEAQDFEPTWFQCVLATMKDPKDGDLVIVGDGNQRLYKRKGVSWASLGIQARGSRSISSKYDLDKNYRNTPGIADLAQHFSNEEVNADGINARSVNADNCRRPNDTRPVFVPAPDHSAQIDSALEIAGRWLKGQRGRKSVQKIKPEDIGIFYPKLGKNEALLERLVAGLSKLAPTRWLWDKKDGARSVNDKAIKVQTVHSAKGLQYKAVIVLWTDTLPAGTAASLEERRQLYVAITRAENHIVLLGSGQRGFAADLQHSCVVRPFPFDPRNGEPGAAA